MSARMAPMLGPRCEMMRQPSSTSRRVYTHGFGGQGVPQLTHHTRLALAGLPAVRSLQPQGKVLQSRHQPGFVTSLRCACNLEKVERGVQDGS